MVLSLMVLDYIKPFVTKTRINLMLIIISTLFMVTVKQK